MRKKIKLMVAVITIAVISSLILVPATVHAAPSKTIVETAIDAGNFTTLVAAVQAAGLAETLSGPGPFTVFAPTDAAFNKLPDGTIPALLADPTGQLTDILLYHVVAGKVMAADVVQLSEATTVGGNVLSIDTTDGVKVDGANVIVTDIECSNGVIHVIDAVMIPPAPRPAPRVRRLPEGTPGFVTYLYQNILGRNPEQAGLDAWVGWLDTGAMAADQVASKILFSNEASQRISGLNNAEFVTFLYEKILGRSPEANGLQHWTALLAHGVSRPDLVNRFTKSSEFVKLCDRFGVKASAELKTIVETAVGAGNFTTLVTAVQAAGLAETLSGPGPFTVFAPTDAAFDKLPDGTIPTLLADPTGQLKDILLYHVVSGRVMAADVVQLSRATTVGGNVLSIDTTDGVKVDGATVIVTDIQCSNGVIHVIDTVMIP